MTALIWTTAAASSPTGATRCFGKRVTKVGTAKANILRGTKRADVIAGLGGPDKLTGGAGTDRLCGDAGDDVIDGGPGTDRIDGGPGFDVCRHGEQLVSCEETAPALPLHGQIEPGRYTPDLFKPRIAFTLSGVWFADEQTPAHVDVQYSTANGPDLDVDSSASHSSVSSVVSDITAVPGLNATTPLATTIGTAAGYEFEVSVAADSPLIVVPDTISYDFGPGDHGRIWVVSASGRTVIVIQGTSSADFAVGKTAIDMVLATVKWEP